MRGPAYSALIAAALAALAAGCDASSHQQLEVGVVHDAAPPAAGRDDAPGLDQRLDRAPDAPCPPGGFICKTTAECCGPQRCVQLPSGVRVCAEEFCDDMPPQGGCPPGFACATLDKGQPSVCLRRCQRVVGSATCPQGLSCDPRSLWLAPDPDGAVCAFPACTGPRDCPVRLSASCDPAASTPQCVGEPAGAFCAPDDLGASGEGTCALPGVCDLPSGQCQPHALGTPSAAIGAPCVDDRDCAGEMRCDRQRVAADGTVHARNGYCTKQGCALAADAPVLACPAGSTCVRHHPGGRCKKTCLLTQASDCRGQAGDKHGDYECYDWTQLAIHNKPVAQSPACEPSVLCSLFGSGPSLDCSAIGLKNNPTQMACRHRTTGAVLPKHDPGGYCLDLTASGP